MTHIEFKDIKIGDWIYFRKLKFRIIDAIGVVSGTHRGSVIDAMTTYEFVRKLNGFRLRSAYQFEDSYRTAFKLTEDEVMEHIVLEFI
jgi:hypothetical protein